MGKEISFYSCWRIKDNLKWWLVWKNLYILGED